MVWFARSQSFRTYFQITALYRAFAPETPGTTLQKVSLRWMAEPSAGEYFSRGRARRTPQRPGVFQSPRVSPNRGCAKDRAKASSTPAQTRRDTSPGVANRSHPAKPETQPRSEMFG